MKKLLVITASIICLLMVLASCGISETVDNPENNINQLIDVFNQDFDVMSSLGSIQTNMSVPELDFNLNVNELPETVDGVELEIVETHRFNGQVGETYFGLKDNAAYISYDIGGGKNDAYVFVEKDLNLVAVMGDGAGNYFGAVEDSLKVIYDDIKASVGDTEKLSVEDIMDLLKEYVDVGDMGDVDMGNGMTASSIMSVLMGEITLEDLINENGDVAEIVEMIKSIELPKLTKEMITYQNGRYYVSDAYILEVINSYLDLALEMSGGYLNQTELNAYKAAIAEYVDAFNVTIYFYIEYGEITGFGFAVNPEKDIIVMMGAEKMNISADITKDSFDFVVDVSSNDSKVSTEIHYKNIYNSKKELTGCSFVAKGVVPQTTYYGDRDGYVLSDLVFDVKIDLDIDKVENSGEFLSVKVKFNESNFKGYVWDITKYDYKVDPTFRDTYSEDAVSILIDVKANSSQGGNKINATATAKLENIDGEDIDANISVTVSKKADNFPAIPSAVTKAKEDALNEYNAQ